MTLDLELLPPPARKILSGAVPGPARLMAARGVIPGLKPADVVTVVVGLSTMDDASIAGTAKKTLAELPSPVLNGALQADLQGPVIESLVEHYSSNEEVVTALLRMPGITGAATATLAERATERIGEIIATNERLLLANPEVIEKLYMNKRVRMSTADRLIELAVRNGLELAIPAFKEAAAAIQDELIPEASEEPTFDDILFRETEELAEAIKLAADEDTHEVDDEGRERVREKVIPVFARIAQMTVTQKIRRATLGSSEERLLLVRDKNRLVASAAANSPQMNENDAARIAASRQMSEDVLRIIARNREFTRNYQVKLNLVMNPKTPLTFASGMIPLLRDSDLRLLSKSKNVPAAIQNSARQHMLKKKKRG